MTFAFALFTYALLVASVVAAPSSAERRARRTAARRAGTHYSRPISVIETADVATNATHDTLSSNWAGAILSADAGTYTSVTGTFTVPSPSMSSASGSPQSASAWVGIDGASCGSAILQTGVDFSVDSSGAVSYDAWYEWFPAGAVDFSGISFSAGDNVKVTVVASSTTSGTATIENMSSGVTVSMDLSSDSALCEQDAEWIVEDFDVGGSMVPFANFGTIAFTGASASTSGGTVGPSGASISDIDQNNAVLTSTTVDDSSVTISYTAS